MNYSFKPEVEIEVGDMVWWREGAVWEMLKSRKDEEVFFVYVGTLMFICLMIVEIYAK